MTRQQQATVQRLLPVVFAGFLVWVAAACASGSRSDGSLRCERCAFTAALAEVVAALVDIDAQVAKARVDEGSGRGELWALIDWRRPAADSAILIIGLSSDPAGTTVSYSAVPLARALETHATATPAAIAPGPPGEVCQPCRAWQVAIEAAPGDNLRALANQRDAARRCGEALAGRLGVRGAKPPSLPAPSNEAGISP